MGRPMARNLIQAGHRLIVLDRNPAPVADLAALGAEPAATPASVAEHAEVVITMLPDSPDVEAVVFDAQGVLLGLRPGALYIDMSTVSPMLAERIAAAGAAQGAAVLDAPVSGGQVGAEKATLSIMVGGSADAYQRAFPILQALGKNIVHCGGPGAGQIVKACNQILVALTIQGVAEALTLGMKAGVDPGKIVQVLGAGLARCGILETRGERMIAADFAPGFRSRLHYKDLRIALAAGQAYEAPLPATGIVHEMFKQMVISGRGELDHTGLLDLLQEWARPTQSA
ncbi:MAG: 2-hydroxy-3-oxopropionate reductase [Chloroflexi bacterium RBG_13_66_10]|nr:MAG: 2-hydroxy-3-oxopropionate reductase [Chloroflexi bacterium RBG_13_66_10]